ncbi:carboxypeptidase M32 [bacterium]|nr:carboxypeptidase M32 [bacterium]
MKEKASKKSAYEKLQEMSKELHVMGSIGALVGWDQEVNMPPKGTEHRGKMMAWLAIEGHKRATHPQIGEWLGEAENEAVDENSKANMREWRREWELATKIPQDLVERRALASTRAHESWKEARAKDDFSLFSTDLGELIEIAKESAEHLGYTDEPYDALLDQYQAGMTTQGIDTLFSGLRNRLVPLLERILDWQGEVGPDPLEGKYSVEEQARFCKWGARHIGFDFDAGRMDTAVHPFCSGTCSGDIRLTTRYDVNDPLKSFGGALHEAGHGLYEQGLPSEHQGTPRGTAVSLGIHESQSLFFESVLGQGEAFWTYALPFFKSHFPGRAEGVGYEEMQKRVNRVSRSLIRVEADEVTYPLHIILRFEMERDIIRGEISLDDLPGVWREKMEELVGLSPEDDTTGVLQDIHWSMGGLGYFPTYALGRLYSAQLGEALTRDHPKWESEVARGDCSTPLAWMRHNIHQRGTFHRSEALMEEATGKLPTADDFLLYLERKYRRIFS